MKNKLVAIIIQLFAGAGTLTAQKFCYVDTDYILAQSPAYAAAPAELNNLSIQWQKELDAKYAEIDLTHKNFQHERILMSEELAQKREAEIVQKEKEAKDFQKPKFGVDGELFKKRQELIKPIQDQVYNAVATMAVRD